jgi:D-galacturonate reductase
VIYIRAQWTDLLTLLDHTGTHYPIARYALEHKLHVLVTKPATQLLSHHIDLIKLANENGVVCMVEHHKRSAFKFLADPRHRLMYM